MKTLLALAIFAVLGVVNAQPAVAAADPATAPASQDDTYTEDEIVKSASGFFQMGSEAVAKAVEAVFKSHGRPNAYIIGSEGSGAIGVGLRYGDGTLYRKSGGSVKVYWQGPSIGFDLGANASKSFTLVYHLPNNNAIFQRFPGVEGSYYFIAGIGVNYQQADGIVLAPIRTGVGLRLGANVGTMSYSRQRNLLPF